jgi:hypothetical protein
MTSIRDDLEIVRATMLAERGDDAWCSPLYVQPGTPGLYGPRDDLYFAEHPRRQYRLRNTTVGERRTYGQSKNGIVVRRTGTKVAVDTKGVCYLDREADAARLYMQGP